ncbi:MAG: CPBP family intramembrane metalloprotease [Clostridia bacterium]|nr:CPBP family intramembrane metalloprotease [Clostridia bacterium]
MNGFGNRPNPELMRERMEKLRRVRQDLRGVGWTMLAAELIHTWFSVLVMGALIAQRVAPQIDGALTAEDLFRRAAELASGMLGTDWYANAVVVITIVTAALGVIPAAVFGRRRSLTLRPVLGLRGVPAKDIALIYVVMMGVNTLGALGVTATDALFRATGFTIYIDIMVDDTAFSYWLMTIYAALLAPLIEEYVFRGVLLEGLRKYGERFAVVSAAVIFGLAHGNLMQFLPAVLIGWFLGYVRMKTGSWGVCVLLHALNNVTSLALDGLLGLVSGETMYTALNILYMAATLAAAAFVWQRMKKRFGALAEPPEPLGFSAFFSAPALIYLYLVFETMITSVTRLG